VNYLEHPSGNAMLLFGASCWWFWRSFWTPVAYRKLPGGSAGVSTKGFGAFRSLRRDDGFSTGSWRRRCIGLCSPQPGKLGPYAAVFVFAIGIFLSNFIWALSS